MKHKYSVGTKLQFPNFEMLIEAGYCSGNQIEGMELCKQAAKILGENPQIKPWN